MATVKKDATTAETVGSFAVDLPSDLVIEPKYKVKVAPNYTAYVYNDTCTVERKVGLSATGHQVVESYPEDCYTVVVRHDTTGQPPRDRGGVYTGQYYTSGRYCSDRDPIRTDLHLKLTLEGIANSLVPKTKTKRDYEEVD